MELLKNKKILEWEYRNYLILHKTKKRFYKNFKQVRKCIGLISHLSLYSAWIISKNALRLFFADSRLYINNGFSQKIHERVEAQDEYYNLLSKSWK